MRYYTPDIACFVRTSPYLTLAKPERAIRFVRRQVEAAEECRSALQAYPHLLVEPLEFFYTCLRSLGALDQPFFEALLRDQSWRGVVWGAWLAMLEPRPALVGALRVARPEVPENDWLVDCAISTIEGRAPAPQHAVFVDLGARCRRCLDGVTRPGVRLRLEPTAAEIAQMAREREHFRSVYAEAGADAARRHLPGTLLGFYALDYARWLRSYPSPPASPDAAPRAGGA